MARILARPVELRFDGRPLWLPLTILGAAGVAAIWLMPGQGYDFYAYWSVDPLDPYQGATEFGGFRYTPPMALVFAPLGLLPFEPAYLFWLGLGLAALWFIARRWFLVLVLFPPVFADLAFGNVGTLYAAMIVAAARWPGVWAFALLTKVTPAVGGWAQWTPVLAVAGVAVAASLVVQGLDVWQSWFVMLTQRAEFTSPWIMPVSFGWRLPLAVLLSVWGVRSGRPWTVPVAVCLAIPTWYWSGLQFAPLVALWRR